MSVGVVALAAVGAGFAGWAVENGLFGPRFSYHAPKIPFLPVYAVGGAAVALLAPHLSSATLLERAAVYGLTLTAIEGAAGRLERAEGRRSWDYGGSPIDLPHALAWAGLGLVLEQGILKLSPDQSRGRV